MLRRARYAWWASFRIVIMRILMERSSLHNTDLGALHLIFPELSEAVAVAELLILSEGGQILLLRSSEEGGKSPPSSSPLLLGIGGGLYINTIIESHKR